MGSTLHLLIVDDQPESLAPLAGHLVDQGHRVDLVADPLAAIGYFQRAERDPYHLALIDVNMPGLDGPGLVRELRRRGDQTPVAFITGYQSIANRLRGELAELRVAGLLTKPPTLQDVDQLIDFAARAQRSTAQHRRATDFGLGSGGHQKIGSGGHRTTTAPGSGGYPFSQVPGPAADDIPFYGTSKTFRAGYAPQAPTEGILAQTHRPADQPDIIPDHLIGGTQAPTAPPRTTRLPSRSPLPMPAPAPLALPPGPIAKPLVPRGGLSGGNSGARTGIRTPFPESDALPLEPTTSVRRRRPETSEYYTPDGDGLAQAPSGTRDPITGTQRNPHGGTVPTALSPLPGEAPRQPGTTSRFRRSVTGPVEQQQPAGSLTTGRIRRGVTGPHTPPQPQPQTPTLVQPTCVVACAHCQGQFTVMVKPEAYAVICVHCGQLNRIDPL